MAKEKEQKPEKTKEVEKPPKDKMVDKNRRKGQRTK